MEPSLFYSTTLHPPVHAFDREESAHMVRVMRMREGDACRLTDGKGMLCECRVSDASPKQCTVEILSSRFVEPESPLLHIAIAPTKNINRFEWFLEKATEIGIREITPVICSHSERDVLKTDRLQKVMIAALKQSHQCWLPLLHEPVMLKKFFKKPFPGQQFIAWCETRQEELLVNRCTPAQDTLILIGPEGDFSSEEVANALEAGFIPVSLGPHRLRTETAAIAGCMVFHTVNQIR